MSGVTLYLVCVSTIMAALQPLALFGSDVSTLPLQQGDALQSSNDSSAQVFPSSQLAPPTADSPVSWQGVWTDGEMLAPGYGRYRPATPTPAPPKWYQPAPPTPAPPKCKWYRPATSKYQPAPPSTNRSNSDYGGSGLQDTVLWENVFARNTITSSGLHPATPLSPPPAISSPFPPGPAYSSCPYNRSNEPSFKPRVASFHAEDWSCHQKGTSCWDPIVNSSYNTNMTGALTLIVQYLQWVA